MDATKPPNWRKRCRVNKVTKRKGGNAGRTEGRQQKGKSLGLSHALTSHSHHDLAKAPIKTRKVSCVESVDGLHTYV